ncbi:MAG TPA: glycosyltransferase [Terriglobales bacterium]|nr:glycosyltransferase [Terriglobales bacterium]
MKVCLVTAFPPSTERLNEYGFHLAKELRKHDLVSLTILADQIPQPAEELPDFDVDRCWKFNSISTPLALLRAVRKHKPNVVWFNLVFSSFGDKPISAFLGICTAFLLRLFGFYTHITLHHVIEALDLSKGTRFPRLYRFCGAIATRLILLSGSVTVLLPSYRKVLLENYRGEYVHLRRHGVFSATPKFPDISKRGNPEHRILAFGKWGTYKRPEILIEAFAQIADRFPNAKLVIAGSNHPMCPGYVESLRERWRDCSRIEFQGYVPEDEIGNLFSSATVLVLPYSSAGGPSGVAHQACEFATPIIGSDIPDFIDMAQTEELAMLFYKTGDPDSLAKVLADLLENPTLQQEMAEQNFSVAVRMTMEKVVAQYLQSFAKALALKRRNKSSKRLPVQTIDLWPARPPRATGAMDTLTPR